MPKSTSNAKETAFTTKKITTKSTTTKPTTSKSSKPTTTKKKTLLKSSWNTTTQKARLNKKISQQTEKELLNKQEPSTKKSVERKRDIPLGIRIFFGCSLFLFCIALYKAILLPNMIQKDFLADTDTTTTLSTLPPIEESTTTEETLSPSVGPAFIKQFYQVFSQKDIDTLISLMDTPLQRSTDIRRFFSSYKITPFIDNIENNKVQPENIQLIDTSPTGVEEYQYELNYHLIPNGQDFKETRVVRIKYTESWPKLASIRCETSRCSYNPFFRPESYGLTR